MKSLLLLGPLVMTLAIGATQVADTRYQTRKLMSEIQSIKSQRDNMRLEWSQLLVEQSMLTDEAIIYQRAATEINMTLPKAQAVVYKKN